MAETGERRQDDRRKGPVRKADRRAGEAPVQQSTRSGKDRRDTDRRAGSDRRKNNS